MRLPQIPELAGAVVPTGCHVILQVGVEVQLSEKLQVRVNLFGKVCSELRCNSRVILKSK